MSNSSLQHVTVQIEVLFDKAGSAYGGFLSFGPVRQEVSGFLQGQTDRGVALQAVVLTLDRLKRPCRVTFRSHSVSFYGLLCHDLPDDALPEYAEKFRAINGKHLIEWDENPPEEIAACERLAKEAAAKAAWVIRGLCGEVDEEPLRKKYPVVRECCDEPLAAHPRSDRRRKESPESESDIQMGLFG